ncbi:hypothetical protein [Anaerotignum sp.]|uniref:hypothetical protein n=1 Tax=Anaerotignum sp. TaxID=2039241 RepID=UPI00289D4202|nr:hypothetical protein [Anaerotignum sp.]
MDNKNAKYVNSTYGSYKHLTTLGLADATGEYFSISESIGVDVSLSGPPLHVGKSTIESALGFSLSAEVNVAITKNSRPLQKGESIIVDYRFKNYKYKVVQA